MNIKRVDEFQFEIDGKIIAATKKVKIIYDTIYLDDIFKCDMVIKMPFSELTIDGKVPASIETAAQILNTFVGSFMLNGSGSSILKAGMLGYVLEGRGEGNNPEWVPFPIPLGKYATDLNNIALGNGSEANGSSSLALGYQTIANSTSIAFGYSALANSSSVAIGINAKTLNYRTIVMGEGAFANAQRSMVFGYTAKTFGEDSIVMGTEARAYNWNQIIIGNRANYQDVPYPEQEIMLQLGGSNSIVIGYESKSKGGNATAIGPFANAEENGVALGFGASSNNNSVAIGNGTSTLNTSGGIAIGNGAVATRNNQIIFSSKGAESDNIDPVELRRFTEIRNIPFITGNSLKSWFEGINHTGHYRLANNVNYPINFGSYSNVRCIDLWITRLDNYNYNYGCDYNYTCSFILYGSNGMITNVPIFGSYRDIILNYSDTYTVNWDTINGSGSPPASNDSFTITQVIS